MKTLFMEFWSFVGWITLYLFICHTVWVNSAVQSIPETSQVPLKYICECDTKANRFSCNCALYSWNLTCKAVVLNVWTLNNHGNCLQHTPLTIKCAKKMKAVFLDLHAITDYFSFLIALYDSSYAWPSSTQLFWAGSLKSFIHMFCIVLGWR